MVSWWIFHCEDFGEPRQSAKSAPYTAGEAAYKQAEDAGLSKEEHSLAPKKTEEKHEGSWPFLVMYARSSVPKHIQQLGRQQRRQQKNLSKMTHIPKVRFCFSLAAAIAGRFVDFLGKVAPFFQAGGKIGEQVTDVAAGVMVKLAPKMGLSNKDLVSCSVQAAQVRHGLMDSGSAKYS